MTDLTRPNRNKTKMLLTMGPISPSVETMDNEPINPTYDSQDNTSNKLMIYLHKLAGNHEIQADVIMKDHNYARPWNWKPESVFVRPAKKIFFSKPSRVLVNEKSDEFVDVEKTDVDTPVPPFDLSNIRQTMDEFQRVSNFIRIEDVDDWEEKIDKILWSPVQNRIFNRVVRILNHERMVRLAKERTLHEPILRRTSINSTAKKFRETLASAHWDWRLTQWLHSLLFDHLPQDYLTIYLDILQCLRQKIPQLIDKMITVQSNVNSKSNAVTWETLGPLLKKSWDPISPMLNAYKPKILPGNPILIVIFNGMSNNVTSRQQKWITQLGLLGMVVTVNTNLGSIANKMTVLNSLEQIIQATRTKIQDVKIDCPNRSIVLIGFNTGAGIACQVALSEHVNAVVCLGFPLSTVDGKRGSSEDLMLDLRCPVMFVIGEHSSLSRIDDVETMRERMLAPTSLVVVGSADDQLRISTSKKITECISQSIVDRCVIDEIADFMGGVLTQPSPMPIRSINSLTNYDNKNKKINDSRKRKNSTSSCSLDSEPQSPCLKKTRPYSPANKVNNVSNISSNALPKGTLVTLTGTTATQTPKSRKARVNFKNFSEQQTTPQVSPQRTEGSPGGITLNIGSLASLSPVGPLRFESSPITLQMSSNGVKSGIKNSANTYIKVPKGTHQVNLSSGTGQNYGKIKMIMPTKKILSQQQINNIVVNKESIKAENLMPTNEASDQTADAPSTTSSSLNTSSENIFETNQTSDEKSTSNVQNNTTLATSETTIPSTTSNKVTDISKASMFVDFKQQVQLDKIKSRVSVKARSTQTTCFSKISSSAASISSSSRSTSSKRNQAYPHNNNNNNIPVQSNISSKKRPMTQDKSSTKKNLKFAGINTTLAADVTTSLNDGLENILDIPIIIAKDGESFHDLGGDLSQVSSSSSLSNNLLLFNGKIQPTIIQSAGAPKQIKYTKIIFTKRNDSVEKNSP